MNSTAGLGPVAAIGVGVALLVMITLLPALLVISGRWVFWPKRPTFGSRRADLDRLLGPGRAAGSRPRPRTVWVGHRRRARPSPASGSSGSTPSGLSTEDPYTKEFDSVDRPAGADRRTASPTAPTRSWSWPTPTRRRRSPQALQRRRRARQAQPPARSSRTASRSITATVAGDATSQAAFDTVDAVRDGRARGRRGRRPRRRRSAIYLDIEKASEPRQPGDHPGRAARGDADPDAAAARRACRR